MSLTLFKVGKGLADDLKSYLSGSGAPGGDSDVQDAAPIGSTYSNISNGDLYTKTSIANNSALDWQMLGTTSGLSGLQDEVDYIEAALGAIVGTNGQFVTDALDTGNYMDSSADLTAALLDLDAAIKVADDAADAAQADATQALADASQAQSDATQALADASTAQGRADDAYDLANAALPLSGGTMTGNIVMSTGTHIELVDAPSNGTDAVNRNYVDNRVAGLTWKNSVKAATTAADGRINLANYTGTIDGQALVNGARYLIKDQAVAAVAEVSTVDTTGKVGSDLGGKYFNIDSTTTAYYVWFNTGSSTDPSAANSGKTGIEVAILDADTAGDVAGKIQTVLEAHSAFGATVLGNVVTVTNAVAGVATDIAAGDSTLSVATGTQGAAAFNGSDNGIYTWATGGAFTRATDFDSLTPIDEINGGAVYIENGTLQGDSGWTVTSTVATLGTDPLLWTQFNGASGVTAGVGLLKTGNVLDVKLGAGIVELPTDEVGIDIYSSGGLWTTVNGSASSTLTGAQLGIKLDGTTLSLSSSGLKIASGVTDEIDAIETSLGALVGTGGVYVPFGTGGGTNGVDTNYINGNASVTADLADLDAAIKIADDAADAAQADATQALSDAAGALSAAQAAQGDADDANTEIGYINTYIGKTAGNYDTDYTGTTYVADGDSLTASIQQLDIALEAGFGSLVTAAGAWDGSTVFATTNNLSTATDIGNALILLDSALASSVVVATKTNVTTAQVVDSVKVDDVVAAKWLVTAYLVGTPTRKQAMEIYAIHDGTASADATAADFTEYARLRLGAAIAGLTANVTLTGSGAAQAMNLTIAATNAVNVSVSRLKVATV